MELASDFEAQWTQCPPASSLIQQRILAFDSYSAITYGRVIARYEKVQLDSSQPSDEWVASSLEAFVRGEFGTEERGLSPYRPLPQITADRANGDEHHQYLVACERDLIYSSHLENLIKEGGQEIPEKIYAFLCDRRLGNIANSRNISLQSLRKILDPLIAQHLRIRFVMPAFPFKDQNPFRTNAQAHQPDLGEIGLLIRLHCLALALWHVYSDGVDWVLLSDGIVYSSIFGVEPDLAREYVNKLRSWRDELNMQRTVAVVDLADLVRRADASEAPDTQGLFTSTRRHIRKTLEQGAATTDTIISQNLAVLRRGMARNLNTRYYPQVSTPEMWMILHGAQLDNPTPEAARTQKEVEERSWEAALEYASFNLALRHHDILGRFLPLSVRATIHAKPGQIAAPKLGRVFPWNGVAVEGSGRFDDRTLTVTALHDVTRAAQVVEKRLADGSPFYYAPVRGV